MYAESHFFPDAMTGRKCRIDVAAAATFVPGATEKQKAPPIAARYTGVRTLFIEMQTRKRIPIPY